MSGTEERVLYRIPPRERIGWMFGLNTTELIVALIAVVGAALLAGSGHLIAAVIIAVVGFAVAAPVASGRSLISHLPTIKRRLQLRKPQHWCAQIPILADPKAPAPRVLEDQVLLAVPAAEIALIDRDMAVVHDTHNGTLAASIRVQGRGFALKAPHEQDWLIARFGVALQAFISERQHVTAIAWSETATSTGLDDHRAWIEQQRATTPAPGAVDNYEQLLAESAASTTDHETLITLTLDANRAQRLAHHDDNPLAPGIELLATELRSFRQRLESADLTVSNPLTPNEWTRTLRHRLDPDTEPVGDRIWPTTTETTTDWIRTDTTYHRALHINEWPRLDVPADWLHELLLYSGTTRTITVIYEPVPASRSRRRIRTQLSRISGDASLRGAHGYRVTADHDRARQAVEEREQELVAGYGEVTFSGIVTLSAPNLEQLDQATAELTQIAATCGADVTPLNGRHDDALAVTLPTARTLKPAR